MPVITELENLATYHNAKTATLEGLSFIDFYDRDLPALNTKDTDVCITYAIWGDPQYVKFLYMSLLSYVKFTDITEYNVKIITDAYSDTLVRRVFQNLVGNENIIQVPHRFNLKWNIPNLPQLQKYKYMFILDTDSFVYDPRGTTSNFFDRLLEEHKDEFLFAFKTDRRLYVFDKMQRVLNKIPDPDKFYRDRLGVDLAGFMDYSDGWHNSSFSFFKRSIADTFFYQRISSIGLNYRFLCDETVFQINNFMAGIEEKALTEKLPVITRTLFERWYEEKPQGLVWLHPIVGSTIDIRHLRSFMEDILS